MNQQAQCVEIMPCLPGLIDRMQLSSKTALELTEEGFDVFAIDVLKDKMPTLQIMHSPACKALIRSEVATYYKRNPQERWGQFTRNECRIIWRELIKPEVKPCA